jgi:exodeoxyribonuclease-1
MSPSFFFYDLETSGLSPSSDRIMQFAGQRTTLDLKPIAQPINTLIKLPADVLPSPDAVLLTGITPQKTLKKGISEVAFLEKFYSEIALKNTIFIGFNNIRFDDEFIRQLNYRNFYDAYAWAWSDNRSRWDVLDLVRLTRALRPANINWPSQDHKPVNKLQELTKANKLAHSKAHDALSDVMATIAVADMIKHNQPKLFEYLFNLRSKAMVKDFIKKNQIFVYTSSHYPSELLNTTLVTELIEHPKMDASLVYNLRIDPKPFLDMSAEALAAAWLYKPNQLQNLQLPVKTLRHNRAPALAPLSVIDQFALSRLQLDLQQINTNLKVIKKHLKHFNENLIEAINILDATRQDKQVELSLNVDNSLYEGGFIGDQDRSLFSLIHQAKPKELNSFLTSFSDNRLRQLLPLYKARNYPESLSQSELQSWQNYYLTKLNYGAKSSPHRLFQARLNELYEQTSSAKQIAILDELKAYLKMIHLI